MKSARPRPGRASAALLVLCVIPVVAGCEAEALELAQEVAAARGDCTARGLRESDEECVRMMERYAGMGTDLVHTYIGGLRALDRALDRMPPAEFHTDDFGSAISPEFRDGVPPGDGASPRLRGPVASHAFSPGVRGAKEDGLRGAEWPVKVERDPRGGYAPQATGSYPAPPLQGRLGPSSHATDHPASMQEQRSRAAASTPGDPAARRSMAGDGFEWSGEFPGGWYGYGRSAGRWSGAGEFWSYPSPYDYLYRNEWPDGMGPVQDHSSSYRYGYGQTLGGYSARPYGYDFGDGVRYGYGALYRDQPGRAYGYDPGRYGHDAGYAEYAPDYYRSDAMRAGHGQQHARFQPPAAGRWADRDAYKRHNPIYRRDDLPPQEDWGYAPQVEALKDGDEAEAAAAAPPNGVPARPAPHRPGILPPPEERLRRPWIHD